MWDTERKGRKNRKSEWAVSKRSVRRWKPYDDDLLISFHYKFRECKIYNLMQSWRCVILRVWNFFLPHNVFDTWPRPKRKFWKTFHIWENSNQRKTQNCNILSIISMKFILRIIFFLFLFGIIFFILFVKKLHKDFIFLNIYFLVLLVENKKYWWKKWEIFFLLIILKNVQELVNFIQKVSFFSA